MNAILTANGLLSLVSSAGVHKIKGPATLSFGDGTADNFGGGELLFIKRLESGASKIIATVTSVAEASKWCRDAGLNGVDAELVGATNPNLYVEIN
ncbi:MAG: hypothetical protein JKY93_00780 [Gammaproteobacteria bacterium]|nr:hypothetical protein [Gammaproteobacteria bacterium]